MSSVTIIGAGPAGTLAGTLLSRAGWDVTLIEQHPFPRDKVCGECLSALGIEVLARASLHRSLQRLHPARLARTTLHAPDGSSVTLPLTRVMWGLSRRAMDVALLEEARTAGVRIMQPARCERIESTPKACVVTTRDLTTNRTETVESEHILLADGKAALLPQRPRATTDFGIKAHFTGVRAPIDVIALFGVRNHYGGVAPIESNRWNAAFSIPAPDLESTRGDLDRLFASILKENRALASQFTAAQRVTPWLASPLPRFPIAATWPSRIIPLGNAAAALEPIGGEGMGLALRSAELAAESLISDPIGADRPALRRSFHRLWHLRRPACRAAAKMISSPLLARPIIELLAANEPLGRFVLQCIGKSA